jgi:hypothetical protein
MSKFVHDVTTISPLWVYPIMVITVVIVVGGMSALPGTRDILLKMTLGNQGSIVLSVRSIVHRRKHR